MVEQVAVRRRGLAPRLAPRLQEVDSWDRNLPLRAQQRLGIARLFLHNPPWVFIEEATDAFDPKGEAAMLEMIHRELPNTTQITISFHSELDHHYSRKLILNRLSEPRLLFGISRLLFGWG